MKRRAFLRKAAIGLTATPAVKSRDRARAAAPPARVLCWSELTEPKEVYPEGTSGAIAKYLNTQPGLRARTRSIDDPGQGISTGTLEETDVLIWWGHSKHDQILPDRVAEVVRRVKDGKLGFIGIHSGKDSKIFQPLLNDTGRHGEWRHDAGPETLKVVAPFHPIARASGTLRSQKRKCIMSLSEPPYRIPSYFSATGKPRSNSAVVASGKWAKDGYFTFVPVTKRTSSSFSLRREKKPDAARWCAHRT